MARGNNAPKSTVGVPKGKGRKAKAKKPMAPDDGRKHNVGFFEPGNDFWRARVIFNGHPRMFETVEDFALACDQYFEWVRDNPLIEMKPFAYEGRITFAEVPKMRAMSVPALQRFIGISNTAINKWEDSRPDLWEVYEVAKGVIHQQKFEGAAAGMLSAIIVSRDLGLVDKSEQTGGGVTVNIVGKDADL